MRRGVIMLSVLVAALTALALALILSPVAKQVVRHVAEREIGKAFGREVEIGAVEGDLFRKFQLTNVYLKDGAANWAEIARVEIDWNPRALLARQIEITALSIEDATILAPLPPSRKSRPFKGFELPERLPALSIGEIIIRNLGVDQAIAGESVRLDGKGSVAMGGRALSVKASLSAIDGRDDLRIDVERSLGTGRIALDGQIRSTSQGAIAALARSGGPIDLAAIGAGANEDFSLRLSGRFGEVGSFYVDMRSNLAILDAVDFRLTAKPGARFTDWIGDVGEIITAEGVYRPLDRGGRLDLRRARVAAGALSGAVDWRNSRKALDQATADLSLTLADNWRPTIQAAIGRTVDLKASLERRSQDFAVTASAATPRESAPRCKVCAASAAVAGGRASRAPRSATSRR